MARPLEKQFTAGIQSMTVFNEMASNVHGHVQSMMMTARFGRAMNAMSLRGLSSSTSASRYHFPQQSASDGSATRMRSVSVRRRYGGKRPEGFTLKTPRRHRSAFQSSTTEQTAQKGRQNASQYRSDSHRFYAGILSEKAQPQNRR